MLLKFQWDVKKPKSPPKQENELIYHDDQICVWDPLNSQPVGPLLSTPHFHLDLNLLLGSLLQISCCFCVEAAGPV